MKVQNIEFNTADQNVFFTSDTHFYHRNIMKYCNRPFETVEEMNKTLINNWNAVVKENDIVFHLGDFGFAGSQEINDILNRLNGKIYLIMGNHDRKMIRQGYTKHFEDISMAKYIRVNGQQMYLCHFPFLCFDGVYGRNDKTITWQLFGHVHSGPNSADGLDEPRLANLFPSQYDVGVDNNNFTPISFDNVKKIIEEQINSNKHDT